jgi:hypothetical protein
MRLTWLGTASLLSLSLSFGCSTQAPATPSQQAPIRIDAVTGLNTWATTLVEQYAHMVRRLPPAVQPPGPVYRQDQAPRAPACLLCPTPLSAAFVADGWQLGGRPDPVDLANALGAPALSAAIADRITDAEIALAETAAGDVARADSIVAALAADFDALAQAL